MQKLTYDELVLVLTKSAENHQESTSLERMFGYEEVEYYTEGSDLVGPCKIVHTWGGEGKGDSIGLVYYFNAHDIYIQIDGYYDSWSGTDWSAGDIQQVFPSINIERSYSTVPLTQKNVDKLHKQLANLLNEQQ